MDTNQTNIDPPTAPLGLWLGALIAATWIAMGMLAAQSFTAAAKDGSSNLTCQERTAIDYLAPFQRMRAAHPPPAGNLPFGPGTLKLQQTALSQIVLEGRGGFGYVGIVDGNPMRSSRHLGWLATAQLQALRPNGTVKGVSHQRKWNLNSLKDFNGREFSLNIARHPALYRYVLELRLRNGTLLKRYSQYLRSVPRTLSFSVVTDKETYSAGSTIVFRMANAGTESVTYGGGGSVSVFNGTEWTPVFRIPSLRHRRATVLGPGEASRCQTLQIPASLPSGHYRIEKKLSPVYEGKAQIVTDEFHVMQ